MGEYLLFQLMRLVTAILPIRICYLIAAVWGEILCHFQDWKRLPTQENFARVLNLPSQSKEVRAMTRRSFRSFGYYLAEFLSPSWRINRWFSKTEMEGLEHFAEAYQRDKGIILLSGHYGNWELGGMAIAWLGHRLSEIALSHPHPKLDGLFNQLRGRTGVRVLAVGNSGHSYFKVLQQNEMVATLGDRDTTKNAIAVPFFGSPGWLPKGPATLACLTGATIVPVFFFRTGPGRFKMKVYPGFCAQERSSQEIERLTREIAKVLEQVIREDPSQWMMVFPIWNR